MLSVNRIWKTTYSRDKLSQPYNGVVFGSVLPTIFQVIEVFKTKMGISISLAALMTSYSQQGRYVVAQSIEAFSRWRKLLTTQQIILNDFSISPFGVLPSLWQSFFFSLFEWNSQRQNLSEHSLMYSVKFPEKKETHCPSTVSVAERNYRWLIQHKKISLTDDNTSTSIWNVKWMNECDHRIPSAAQLSSREKGLNFSCLSRYFKHR